MDGVLRSMDRQSWKITPFRLAVSAVAEVSPLLDRIWKTSWQDPRHQSQIYLCRKATGQVCQLRYLP